MPVHYENGPEVESIGRQLMRDHHRHLLGVEVRFLFQDKTPTRNGREQWGCARKVTSLNAFLAGKQEADDGLGAFFVIVISRPIWEQISEAKRIALVDHELSHCWVEEKDDGSPSLLLLSHDLEEFGSVVARHGLWRDDVQRFHDIAVTAAQQSLYAQELEADAAPRLRMA